MRGCSNSAAAVVELFDPTTVHDGDPVPHRQRLLLVVGDEDERRAGALLDPLELDLHLLAELLVQGAEGLVEEQDAPGG